MTLSKEIAKTLQLQISTIENETGDPQLPQVKVPPFGERADKTLTPEDFREMLKKQALQQFESDNSLVLITYAASPHTIAHIPTEEEQEKPPAHLLVWWFKKEGKSLQRLDMLALSQLEDEKRKEILSQIAEGIRWSVNFLRNKLNLPEEQISKFIEIYGLTGHATTQERKETGLSRGAQSNPEGHLSVVYHPYEEYSEQATQILPTTAQLLKHLGPFDTVLHEKLKSIINALNFQIAKRT